MNTQDEKLIIELNKKGGWDKFCDKYKESHEIYQRIANIEMDKADKKILLNKLKDDINTKLSTIKTKEVRIISSIVRNINTTIDTEIKRINSLPKGVEYKCI